MLHPARIFCNLNELNNSLVTLKEDLIAFSTFEFSRIQIPMVYNSTLSDFRDKQDEKSSALERCNKILDALISSNFYLNALSNERIEFDTFQFPSSNGTFGANNEKDELIFSSVFNLKEYLEIFKEKTWKSFAEINSFCTLVMSTCKTMSFQEAEEVVYALKLSLEIYERAITFDISYPDNAENVLCALENVTSSTRSMHSYLWAIKTLMTHSTSNSNQ